MEEKHMHIIINNSSMVPIYEQIIDQIKSAIIREELQPDTVLPSVRSLSKELKISVIDDRCIIFYCVEFAGFVSGANALRELSRNLILALLCF